MKENVIQCNTSKSYSNSNTCDMVKEVKRDYIESPNIKTPEKRCKSYNKGYCNKYNCKCFRCVIHLNNKKRKKRIKNISI